MAVTKDVEQNQTNLKLTVILSRNEDAVSGKFSREFVKSGYLLN